MRAERLRRTKDIDAVRASGEAMNERHFTMRARRNGLSSVRIAVGAPRSLGGAVQRNRARRRIREALRAAVLERPASEGADLIVVARGPALTAPFPELRSALIRRLDGVLGAPR